MRAAGIPMPMTSPLRSAVALAAAFTVSALAQSPSARHGPVTPEEKSQGFSNHSFVAKPRAGATRETLAAAESAEGRTLRHVFPQFGGLRVLKPANGETVPQAIERLRSTGRYEYV